MFGRSANPASTTAQRPIERSAGSSPAGWTSAALALLARAAAASRAWFGPGGWAFQADTHAEAAGSSTLEALAIRFVAAPCLPPTAGLLARAHAKRRHVLRER